MLNAEKGESQVLLRSKGSAAVAEIWPHLSALVCANQVALRESSCSNFTNTSFHCCATYPRKDIKRVSQGTDSRSECRS